MDLPVHPLADLFPLVEGIEFDELVSSIKMNGLFEPIITLEGTVLDGRNRYRACQAAGIEPRFEEFKGDDPYAFVAAKNIHRRHLNASQRGVIAAKMVNIKLGDNQHVKEGVEISTPSISAAKAAEVMAVDRKTVFEAKTVLAEGTAEEIQAVKEGKAAVSTTAAKIRSRRAKKEKKARRRVQATSSVPVESQHDRDLRTLRQVWESTCESARAEFMLGFGVNLNKAA